jgi:hypothetical protein
MKYQSEIICNKKMKVEKFLFYEKKIREPGRVLPDFLLMNFLLRIISNKYTPKAKIKPQNNKTNKKVDIQR